MPGSDTLHVVILAAGQGRRMRSSKPKVLHTLAGRPLLEHVISRALGLGAAGQHVVVGYQADEVRSAMAAHDDAGRIRWVVQADQKGTGHAVALALSGIGEGATVLVLYGDVPLVALETLEACVEHAREGSLGLVTAEFENPAGLGRIVRSDGQIVRIVEDRDASPSEQAITEINSGILACEAGAMKRLLDGVGTDNAQGEIYLTDIIELARRANIPVRGVLADAWAVTGVNDRIQLAALERRFQRMQAERLMAAGVTLADPERLDIRGEVRAGKDCFIDVNVVLGGEVVLGDGVHIGPGSVIRDSALGDAVRVEPHTVVEGAMVAARCQLGPFARIRPRTELGEEVKVGNFAETKKAKLGRGTKASHLTYLGDATLGEDCNVGAGTVTCNYDGADKHETHIGNEVFVGTNTTFVAPVEVGDGAFIAAGSTITKKVEDADLAVGRGKQRNIKNWVAPAERSRDTGEDS